MSHGEFLQNILEKTREAELKKVFLPRDKKNENYWWNENIAPL